MNETVKRNFPAALLLSLAFLGGMTVVFRYSLGAALPWWALVGPPIGILLTGVLLLTLSNHLGLLGERTNWLLVCYVVLVGCFPQTWRYPQAFGAALGLVGALWSLMWAGRDPDSKAAPYMTGFFVTAAWWIYEPSLFWYVLFLVGLARLSKLRWREFLAFLGGAVTVCLGVVFVAWWCGEAVAPLFLSRLSVVPWTVQLPSFDNVFLYLAAGFLALVSLTSLICRWVRHDRSASLIMSRCYELLFLWLALAFGLWLGWETAFPSLFPIMAAPLAMYITWFFTRYRQFWARLLLAVMLGLLLLHGLSYIY